MKIFAPFLVAALATRSWAVPTLYLAGDSTMASGGGGSGTQGLFTSLPFMAVENSWLTKLR
jgi:hypothetical protein